MAWYETAKTNITVEPYDPTLNSGRNALTKATEIANKGAEIANKGAKFDQTQAQNMDFAFTNSVEQRKSVDPKTGAVTYALYLDPDKYSNALFTQSKKTGVPFDMDQAQEYAKYQLARQDATSRIAAAGKTQERMGLQPEGQTKKEEVKTPRPIPQGQVGESRKAADGKTYIFDGKGWYDPSVEVGF